MKIKLVGATKPIVKKWKYFDFFRRKSPLEIDYKSIDKILENESYKKEVIRGLKRFTQNFARKCYSKYDWNTLLKEKYNENLIDGRVLPSKHHSVFEHIWLNLDIDGLPKILAMILNNEKQNVTSEKSARYTQMASVDSLQEKLYNKWMDKLIPLIEDIYPSSQDLKKRNDSIVKLAQENARYMTSGFTNTKMAYTVNLRQLNFLINEFENSRFGYCSNEMAERLKPFGKEFAKKVDSLKIKGLEHKVDKKLSLFDERNVENYFGDVYATSYTMSIAALAQSHRHRAISYHVSDGTQLGGIDGFYIPKIIEKNNLEDEWLEDTKKVAKYDFPQSQLLWVNERGMIEDFRLKSIERICGHAQHEIMKNVLSTANEYPQYQNEYGINYDKPKCLQGQECNSKCVWGGSQATQRII